MKRKSFKFLKMVLVVCIIKMIIESIALIIHKKKEGKSGNKENIVPKLINPYWILNWFVLKAFDLKAWEITATAAGGLVVQLEDWWMTYSRQ